MKPRSILQPALWVLTTLVFSTGPMARQVLAAEPYANPTVQAVLSGNTDYLGIDQARVVEYTSSLLEQAGVTNETRDTGSGMFFLVSILSTQLHAMDNPDMPTDGTVASVICRAGRYVDGGIFVYWESQYILGTVGVSPSLMRSNVQSSIEKLVQDFAIEYHQHRQQASF